MEDPPPKPVSHLTGLKRRVTAALQPIARDGAAQVPGDWRRDRLSVVAPG